MLGKKPRQVTRSDSDPIGKLIDVAPVERASLDQRQRTLDRCPCALPAGQKGACFGTAS